MLVSAVFSLFVAEPETKTTPETEVPQVIGLEDSVLDIPQYFPPGDTNKPKNPNNRPGDPTTQGYVTPLALGMPKNVEISYEISEDGKGYYIYSGYSWFRELPAGVPGAYRLFVNMLSIGGDKMGGDKPSN